MSYVIYSLAKPNHSNWLMTHASAFLKY